MKKRAPNYQKERGQRQEDRVIATLTESPKGLQQIADALSFSVANASIYIRRLRATHKVHVVGFEKRPGRPAPIWAAGPGENLEYTPLRVSSPVPSLEDRKAHVLDLLSTPRTSLDIANLMHVTKGRAQVYVRHLRTAGKVYIKEWRHPGKRGDLAPVYALGNRADAPKPKETRAQRYKKEMADPEKRDRILIKQRTRHSLNKVKKQPQTWFAALPGAQGVVSGQEMA